MRLRISFEPDKADFFRLSETDPDADVAAIEREADQSDLTMRLRGLYSKYAQSYTNLVSIDPYTKKAIAPDYPILSVQIDGEENELVLNSDLFERLCDLYIIYGWRGIQNTEEMFTGNPEKKIKGRLPAAEPESGGTNYPRPALFLVEGYKFFTFTRKIIAILIRQALGRIEKKSAETIIANLSVSSVKMYEAFKNYGLHKERALLRAASPARREKRAQAATYSMSNVKASERLYKTCSDAASRKKNLEDYSQQLMEGRRTQEKLHTSNVPMEMSDARANTETMTQLTRKIEDEQSLLHDLLAQVRQTDPFILLTLPSLKQPFSRKAFENTTGQVLSSMLYELDKFGGLVSPHLSNIREFVPWAGEGRTDIHDFGVPDDGIERAVVQKAVANNAYALLSANVLMHMVSREEIPRDAFENVVLFHYLVALNDHMKRAQEQKKESEQSWAAIGKISSGLAIASLAVPVLGLPLPGATKLLNLALIVNMIHSARGGLESFDKQIEDRLLDTSSEAAYSEALGELGALLNARQEYRDTLAKEVSVELVLTLAGASAGEKSLIAKAFLYRNYYNDIEALYGE